MSARRRIRRSLPAVAIAGSAILAMPLPGLAADPTKLPWEGPPVRVKPGSVVVTFASGTSAVERRATHAAVGARLAPPDGAARVDVVTLPPGLSVEAAVSRYRADPDVIAAEPDRIATLTQVTTDPLVDEQWALDNTGQPHRLSEGSTAAGSMDADVDAPEAWAATTTGDDVVVAVIDSGVHIGHPDLMDRMWVNPGETPGNGMDDDGNGFVDDVNGWDFRGNDPNPSPPANRPLESHGTHVAGIIAAERDNGIGIAGVCGACRIMALRIDLSLGQELRAIRYAVRNGAHIINMSFSSPVWSLAERTAISNAGRAGVLSVVSAGNASLDNDIPFFPGGGDAAPGFPASYTLQTILSVAASNHRDQYGYFTRCAQRHPRWQCGFTSWGHDSVDVAAPGVDIISTVRPPNGTPDGYDVFDGTSMAAPLVAGIAGLVKHQHMTHGPVALKNAVMNSVDRPGSLTLVSAWADALGIPKRPMTGSFTRTSGRVNAFRALNAPTTNATPRTDGNVNGARRMTRRSVRGRVAWPGDVNDVYAKKLRGGRRYRVVLNGPARRDLDLWVWSPKVTEIHQFTIDCFRRPRCPTVAGVSASFDADEAVTFRVRRTNRYYLQVQGFYSGGRYTLSVRRV
jgi:subtilisin family serine protease